MGCAQNTVPLVYNSPSENTIPAAGAPTVCVVAFTDNRSAATIGVRSDGTDFMPNSDVRTWVTQALGTEIARRGLIVTRAGTEAEAKSSGASYIVLGSVDEIWITEKHVAEYETRMRSTLTLKRGSKTVLNQSFSTSLARRVAVGPNVPKELLSEAVADLAGPMARTVYEHVHR